MSEESELIGLDRPGIRTPLPGQRWVFDIDLGQDPDLTWARITAALREIISHASKDWPGDDYWASTLPEWLTSVFMAAEETRRRMAETPRRRWHELPWDFGSWLDAIRDRKWRWWGYERAGSNVRLVLEMTDIPPRLDAFRQIVFAAGARIDQAVGSDGRVW